jgi:hypothetical protein
VGFPPDLEGVCGDHEPIVTRIGQPSLVLLDREMPVLSAVTQLGDRALVQALLMGMALGPDHLLGMHIGAFAVIVLGVALGDQGLPAVFMLLASPRPGHVAGLAVTRGSGQISGFHHHSSSEGLHSFCSGCYHISLRATKRDLGSCRYSDRAAAADPLEWAQRTHPSRSWRIP